MSKEELKDENLDEEIEDEEEKESATSTKDVKNDADEDKSKESDEVALKGHIDDDTNKNNAEAETDEENKTIPYSRFKEINDKYKAVKAELDELKNGEQETETTETNNENENNESVETETENETNDSESNNSKEELEKYKTAFNNIYQTKLDSVPEEYRDLIPEGDELSKLQWVETAFSKGLFEVKRAESFGNQGSNPREDEKESNTGFIKGLSRKF